MKLKTVSSAVLLALAAAVSQAAPVMESLNSVNLVADSHGGYSAGISKTHSVAGFFTDTYILSGLTGFALLDGILQTAGRGGMDIDFSSASINGIDFLFSKNPSGNYIDFREIGVFSELSLSSPFVLTINGHAGKGFTDGAVISATYSGTINVNVVPEPAGYALAGIGLLAAGLASRRRKAAV